jgi:Tol biopolymer transport system component
MKHSNAALGRLMVILLLSAAGCPLEERQPLNPTRLTGDPGDETAPAFSPDGKWVVYASREEGRPDGLFITGIDGRDKRRLTKPGMSDDNPDWSRDGKWVAFQRAAGKDTDICVVRAASEESDNNPTRRLTAGGVNESPSWSPDGRFIAFDSIRSRRSQIYVMNAGGDNEHVLTQSTNNSVAPAWSPNGKLIAFATDRTGDFDIWMMNPDGSLQRRLTTDPAQELRPKWLPDSRELIHVLKTSDGRAEFWSVFRSGKGAKVVVAASNESICDPVVSPDGKWLAFSANRFETYDLFLLKLRE